MPLPLPETLPEEIKLRIESYDRGLIGFAEQNGIPRSTVYGMFLNGGSQRKGLKQLVAYAKELKTKAADILYIIRIDDENTRRYELGKLLTTAGARRMTSLDKSTGMPEGTFHKLTMQRRGLRLLNRCELVSKNLGMTLEEFSKIS